MPAPCPSPGQPTPTPAETGYSCSPANAGARNPDKSSAEPVNRALPAGSEEPETRAPAAASRNRDGLVMTLAGIATGAGRGVSRGWKRDVQGGKGHPAGVTPRGLPRELIRTEFLRIPTQPQAEPQVNHQPRHWKIPFPASPGAPFRKRKAPSPPAGPRAPTPWGQTQNQTALSIATPRAALRRGAPRPPAACAAP